MHFVSLESVLYLTFCIQLSVSEIERIYYDYCDVNGFTCTWSKEKAHSYDVQFSCNKTRTDIQIFLWEFTAPSTIQSLIIQNCAKVQLSFSCTDQLRDIKFLKIQNVGVLEIMQSLLPHIPRKVIFKNIGYIKTLSPGTFSQISKLGYHTNCWFQTNELDTLEFHNTNFGRIETEAFQNLTEVHKLLWSNVTIGKMEYAALNIKFLENGTASIQDSNFEIINPFAFQITSDIFSITGGTIQNLWPSSVIGTITNFEFSNNSVDIIQSGAISVLSRNVTIKNNDFKTVESGAFKKITPGLLHDSHRSFGDIKFVYKFNNNSLRNIEDSGIRPDMRAYKNVASEVNFTENSLQCSGDTMLWLGPNVDLGFGYNNLKDFKTIISDTKNKYMCKFKPCMCFTSPELN